MANLSATSPWIEAGKGIQSAIQNVGAIQGIIRNKNLMEREEAEAPLRMQNLQRQGKMQDLQMQEMEIGNKPVSVDDTLQKMFPDRPMTKKLVEDLAIPFMETDEQGKRFVRNKNIPKIFEQMNTLQFSQKAALSTLADIDLKIEGLKPQKDATGKEVAVDPIVKERNQMEIDRLNEQKSNLKKMYKLLHSGDIVETVDEKGMSHWFDKTTGELVKELEGKKGVRATTSARPTVVPPGSAVLGPDNQPIFTNPAKPATEQRPQTVAPGGVLVDSEGKVLFRNPKPESATQPKPPTGYRYDPDGRLEPIPGGPIEKKIKAEKSLDDNAFGSSVAELNRMQSQAENLLKRPIGRITGVVGMVPSIPGSEAANAEAQLKTLKSQIGFNVLQAMRAMSKTGGALGQVSEKENEYLQQNLASLEQAQSEDELKASLNRIINYAKDSKIRLQKAYDAKWANEPVVKQGKIGRFQVEEE